MLPITPKSKVIMRSLERTTRALLLNVNKQYVGKENYFACPCIKSPVHLPGILLQPPKYLTVSLSFGAAYRNPGGPLAARIMQCIERLAQTRNEVLDDSSRKRAAPSEPVDGLDQSKRAKRAPVPGQIAADVRIPPLPEGPVSIAQLFTLTDDVGLRSFDVTQLPIELVVKLTVPVMQKLDQGLLDKVIEVGAFAIFPLSI
jgi:symplekin